MLSVGLGALPSPALIVGRTGERRKGSEEMLAGELARRDGHLARFQRVFLAP